LPSLQQAKDFAQQIGVNLSGFRCSPLQTAGLKSNLV